MKIRIIIFIVIVTAVLISCGNNDVKKEYTSIIEGTPVRIPVLSGGQITGVYFETGEYIKAGQVIAQIDSLELHLQKEQVHASITDLQIQKKIARTNLQKVEEDLSYVTKNKERIESLVENNSLPQQKLDDINNKLKSINSAVITARQNLNSLVAKEKHLKAQLKLLQKKLKDTLVKSPSGGIVTAKYYENGEAVPPMSPIAEVIDIKEMEAKIYISEKQLAQIKTGQQAQVLIDGIDESLTGTIIWISPRAEFTPKTIMTPETRTSLVYAVKINIENRDNILKDGMPVVVKL